MNTQKPNLKSKTQTIISEKHNESCNTKIETEKHHAMFFAVPSQKLSSNIASIPTVPRY